MSLLVKLGTVSFHKPNRKHYLYGLVSAERQSVRKKFHKLFLADEQTRLSCFSESLFPTLLIFLVCKRRTSGVSRRSDG